MKMNAMKLSLIAAVAIGALASSTTVTLAQSTNSAPGAAHGQKGAQLKERLERIAAELQLTDQQKEQARPIIREFLEQGRSLRQDTSLTAQERREKMKDLRQEAAAKLKPILTPEQLEKWQNLRNAARSKKQES